MTRVARPRGFAIRGSPAASLAFIAALFAAACVSEPNATYRHTYQSSDTGSDHSRTSSDLLDIGYQGDIGSDLQIRASERAGYTDLDVKANGTDEHETQLLDQPSLDVVLRTGALAWTQGLEVQEIQTSATGSPKNDFTRTDALEKIEWSPVDLPKLSAWFSSQADRDDLFVDRRDDRWSGQIEDNRGPFSWSYTFESERLDDLRADVDRERVEHLLRLAHHDDYLDGKVSSTLSVFIDERTITTHAPGGGAIPPGQIQPVAGLSLLDNTPQVGILAANPALIDGVDNVSAGINIGGFASGGQTFWNVGVENQPNHPIDLLLLYTDVDASAFANQFSFAVWASDDNDLWTLVTGATAFTYEGAFRRFKIPIPSVGQRYLKLVNNASPPGAPAINVTEIQTFENVAGSVGKSSVGNDDSIHNATWNLSWRATDSLILGYDMFVGTTRRSTDDVLTSNESRVDTGLSANWTPVEKVAVNLRAENQSLIDTKLSDETRRQLTGLVDYQPIDTLDFALNYTWSDRILDGSDALRATDTQFRASARWLDSLRTDLTFGRNVQDDGLNDRQIERYLIALQASAEVIRHLNLTLGVRHEPATVSGPGAAGVPDPSSDSVQLLALAQPSPRLTAQAELDWRNTYAENGLQQRYRLDWIPFEGGTIDVQFDYDRIDGDTLNPSLDRLFLLTRWNINPKALLEFDAATQIPEFGDRTDSLTASLVLRW